MSTRDDRIKEILRDLGARFLLLNSNGSSLITVTNVELTNRAKNATVFCTVFRTEFEKTALEFAKRKRSEFKEFVMEHSKLGRVPQLDFDIDTGEKNRQKIDDLLSQN